MITYEQEVTRLRNRVETLELELEQALQNVDKLMGAEYATPEALRLSPQQHRVLMTIAMKSPLIVPTSALMVALKSSDDIEDIDNLLKAVVCQTRAKLNSFDINIRTSRGVGYSMSEASASKFLKMVEEQSLEARGA